jgi:hypothetical protein
MNNFSSNTFLHFCTSNHYQTAFMKDEIRDGRPLRRFISSKQAPQLCLRARVAANNNIEQITVLVLNTTVIPDTPCFSLPPAPKSSHVFYARARASSPAYFPRVSYLYCLLRLCNTLKHVPAISLGPVHRPELVFHALTRIPQAKHPGTSAFTRDHDCTQLRTRAFLLGPRSRAVSRTAVVSYTLPWLGMKLAPPAF